MSRGRARRIAICGAGRASQSEAALAFEVARLVARRGGIVVCGGLGGVMEAACRGARKAGGLSLGILPGNDPATANAFVSVPIPTGLGEARNFLIVYAAEAVIAVGGELGTLSEIAIATKNGRPVVSLGSWSLSERAGAWPVPIPARTPAEAVEAAFRAIGAASRRGLTPRIDRPGPRRRGKRPQRPRDEASESIGGRPGREHVVDDEHDPPSQESARPRPERERALHVPQACRAPEPGLRRRAPAAHDPSRAGHSGGPTHDPSEVDRLVEAPLESSSQSHRHRHDEVRLHGDVACPQSLGDHLAQRSSEPAIATVLEPQHELSSGPRVSGSGVGARNREPPRRASAAPKPRCAWTKRGARERVAAARARRRLDPPQAEPAAVTQTVNPVFAGAPAGGRLAQEALRRVQEIERRRESGRGEGPRSSDP